MLTLKTTTSFCCLLLFFAVTHGLSAGAQPITITNDTPVQAPKEKTQEELKMDLFHMLDIDKDGVITEYEFTQVMKARFKLRDKNGDGQITQEEAFLYYTEIQKQTDPDFQVSEKDFEKFFTSFFAEDTNGDGIITAYENMVDLRKRFKDHDTNQDAVIDVDEYRAYIEK